MSSAEIDLPPSLDWLKRHQDGADWLRRLPQTLQDVLDAWKLRPNGRPFPGGSVSLVLPVRSATGRYVLKLQWPHEESLHEADALRAWQGRGAVKLIRHDPERHALLLEHCRPGDLLADCPDVEPIGVLTALLPRLWVDAGFACPGLADEAQAWASGLPEQWERAGRPCERRLIDEALAYIDALAGTQGPPVLLHQDLHGHNVIAAEREPWLVIDPKPLLGEREFALAPIVRSFEFGHSAQATIARLDGLADALGLDRSRALGWTVVQTMAWGFGGAHDARHHQTVRWLLDAA